jgi:hypothetical protein
MVINSKLIHSMTEKGKNCAFFILYHKQIQN